MPRREEFVVTDEPVPIYGVDPAEPAWYVHNLHGDRVGRERSS